MSPAATSPERRPPWLLALLAAAILAAVSAVLLEVAARGFWSLRHGIPVGSPGRILHAWYPELERVARKQPSRQDGFYDVLLLGGSALNGEWGSVEQALAERLAFAGRRNVRVFNLAMAGHTTRDSRLKYAALRRARFELVVVYHGINDTRANNVPPELFRDDYSHYTWYETVNAMARYSGRTRFALPYTLRFLRLTLRQRSAPGRYLPPEAPREDWLPYAAVPRSAAAFEANLGAILALAAGRGDQMLLATFATYVPPGYTPEAFARKQLDYGLHRSAIEEWGRPEHVLAAITAQNEVVRRLAGGGDGPLFVDQARLMAGEPRWFNDVCHFTVEGSMRFAEHLAEAVVERGKRKGEGGKGDEAMTP